MAATKLSYMHFNHKLDLNSPNSTQKLKLCQNFNLNSFNLKFHINISLLVYFQISLVPLNFDKYNLSYLHLIHCCPILVQTETPINEKLLKIHFLSFYPKILHIYTHLNSPSNKLSFTQFG